VFCAEKAGLTIHMPVSGSGALPTRLNQRTTAHGISLPCCQREKNAMTRVTSMPSIPWAFESVITNTQSLRAHSFLHKGHAWICSRFMPPIPLRLLGAWNVDDAQLKTEIRLQ
jgi:hypothetical protein